MVTLSYLIGIHLGFLLMGVGLTSRSTFMRESGWAVLLGPLVGHIAFILLSVRLCASFMTGRHAVLSAFLALGFATLLSSRAVLESFRRFLSHRDLLWIAAGCSGMQILSCLPAIATGIDTYNGYGNLDAWYYVTDAYLLKDLGFWQVLGPHPFQMLLQTAGPATRVGPEFAVMLVAALTHYGELPSYNLVLASFLGLASVSVAFLCREILDLNLKWTLLGVGLAGIHSSLALVYCYQHIGHLLSLAAVPVAIAMFWVAVKRGGAGLWGLACLMGGGCLYAYWQATPMYAMPVCLLATWACVHGDASPRAVVGYGLGVLAVAVITHPQVFGSYVTAVLELNRLVPHNDPILVAFNPYLTEDLLPIYTGLTDSGLSLLWSGVGPERYWQVALTLASYHAVALLVLGVAIGGLIREGLKGRPLMPMIAAVYGGLLFYTLEQGYAYGVYKLVSWTQVFAALSFLLGLKALWSGGPRGMSAPRRLSGVVALLLYVTLNARTSYDYGRRSLTSEGDRFTVLKGFARNPDWQALERWPTLHHEGPILIGLQQHAAQYWASFRLRTTKYLSLVPHDVVGAVSPEAQIHNQLLRAFPEAGRTLTLQPEAVSQCRYYLDWAMPNDIAGTQIRAAPIEASQTFRLYDLASVNRVLSVYDGWHALETYDPGTGRQGPFRWMQNEGSLLLFRFPTMPIRLVLSMRAGLGYRSLQRTVSLTHRDESVGDIALEGSARWISRPFVPSGDLDTVKINVLEQGRPIPRKFTLWNRWVAQDPRVLALGVDDIHAVDESAIEDVGKPIQETYRAADVRRSLLYDGLYSDGWLGKTFHLNVPQGAKRQVVIKGHLVQLGPADLPNTVRVRVNGALTKEVRLERYGAFAISADLLTPAPKAFTSVELQFEKSVGAQTSYSPGQDVRRISALLDSVEFVDGVGP